MLPAISAELPGYLMPPRATTQDAPTTESQGSGPAASLELSAEAAREALSRKPGAGLYGPDGRFVDPTHRKAANAHAPVQKDTPPSTTKTESRELPLDAVDSAVPPAERAELKRLADRITRRSDDRPHSAADYKKIANLMERVGRYDQARDAQKRAKELDPQLELEASRDEAPATEVKQSPEPRAEQTTESDA